MLATERSRPQGTPLPINDSTLMTPRTRPPCPAAATVGALPGGSNLWNRPARLIAGHIPGHLAQMAADMSRALDESEVLTEQRARPPSRPGSYPQRLR